MWRVEGAVTLGRPSSGHSIGLTLASMKAVSSESSPYLAYNCWSISGIGLDQSMSEDAEKSCRGTYFQVLAGLCCVTLRTPSIARANLDFTYFRHASASALVPKDPMVMNVWVTGTLRSSSRGLPVFRAGSPADFPGLPPKAGVAAFLFSEFPGPVMYSLRIQREVRFFP